MSTRAEQFHADEQRHGLNDRAKKKAKAKKSRADKEVPHEMKRAGKKATYAKETKPNGHPSRKSTRAAANRAKPDANLTLRAERAERAPTNRARKARRKAAKVRGSSSR